MRVVAVAVVLILVLTSLVLLRVGRAGAPEGVPAAGAETVDPPKAMGAEPGFADSVTTAGRVAVVAEQDRPDQDRVLYHLKIVRGEDRKPVSGASVHWLDAERDRSGLTPEEHEEYRLDPELEAIRYGRALTTDRDGRVVVPGPPTGISVHARREAWYGMRRIILAPDDTGALPDPEPEYLLELQVDRTLVVRTVDVTGAPVPGVPVRLSVLREDGGEVPESLPPTDPEGLTRRPHAQRLVRTRGNLPAASLVARLYGGRTDPVPVDLLEIPEDPVEITLPELGTLEVTVLGPDGRPWTGAASRMRVVVVDAESPPTSIAGREHTPLKPDGTATVERVVCGTRLRIMTLGGPQANTDVDGPRVHGERLHVELRMASDMPVITGRFVDASGGPVTGVFAFNLFTERGRVGMPVETDDQGRFRTALGSRALGEALRVEATERPGGRSAPDARTVSKPLG